MQLFSIAWILSALSLAAQAAPAPPLTAAAASQKILEYIKTNRAVASTTLDPLYDALDPIRVPDVFGIYSGNFFCGRPDCTPTWVPDSMARWAGKLIYNETYVRPFLTWPTASNHSILLSSVEGSTTIRNMEAFGKTQATLISPMGPINGYDYLRLVSNDSENGVTLMGKGYMGSIPAMYLYLQKNMSLADILRFPDGSPGLKMQ